MASGGLTHSNEHAFSSAHFLRRKAEADLDRHPVNPQRSEG